MHKLSQILNAGNYAALGSIGIKLVHVAYAASQDPSPADTQDYKKAMGNLGVMGYALTRCTVSDCSAGHFASKALHYFRKWATVAQPGGSGADGCGDWNLPQSDNC